MVGRSHQESRGYGEGIVRPEDGVLVLVLRFKSVVMERALAVSSYMQLLFKFITSTENTEVWVCEFGSTI